MPKYLVLSDLHFGDPRCSLHDSAFAEEFIQAIQEQIEPSPIFGHPSVSEVIFLGDTLDLEKTSLRELALEENQQNFKNFVSQLDEAISPTRYLYVIGNADHLLLQYHETEQLAKELWQSSFEAESTTLYHLDEIESFLKSLFPAGSEVVVKYPAHLIELQNFEEYIVLTHGHHFDASQSMGKNLNSIPKKNQQEIYRKLGGIDHYNRMIHEQYIVCSQNFYRSLHLNEMSFWIKFFQEWRTPKQVPISFDSLKIFIKYFTGALGYVRNIDSCRALISGHTLTPALTQQKGILLGNPGSALKTAAGNPQLGCLLISDLFAEGKVQFRLFQYEKNLQDKEHFPLKGRTIELAPGHKNWLGETIHYRKFWMLQMFHLIARFFYLILFLLFSRKKPFVESLGLKKSQILLKMQEVEKN